ncbi:FAD-dependent oxidoreductase [Cryptosporangium aurantiacum]|uniref:Choline dehydrogenase n=1 Tax=Cryptosporangium aurantiacum TaxID=134849 RepID=A0A1M7R6F3_9ACTN|nr:FAD-dependent oxidoreductase [Cryptosporangium aurantiacum]SHN41887.1 Choline dehydrogenase [Cryptosporangium aurantiacum]
MPFGPGQEAVLAELCDLIVPGSVAAGALAYVERAVAGLTAAEEDQLHAAIGLLGGGQAGAESLARLTGTAAFALLRRLAIEAYYGDFTPPGHTGPTPHETIGFTPPAATRLRKDWSFLDGTTAPGGDPYDTTGPVPRTADVVVVGSGAGGGLIAAELGRRGHDVLVLEAGGYHPAESYTRFELEARHRLWWPIRFAQTGDAGGPVALLAGRCVGGSTVINTKVAMRASEADLARFTTATGLDVDLEPWYGYVEAILGVRTRADWTPSVHRLAAGFGALDATLEPVRSYTDHNCTRCGACLTGCPSNAGKSALNAFLAPALARGEVRVRTHRTVEEVLLADGGTRAVGVAYRGQDGRRAEVHAPVVVLAAGALQTPLILLRSKLPDTPSSRQIGRTLGLHPARLVYGRFDEPQDCHQVYPITAHCVDHQDDADGGFVIEGTTIQDPVAFAGSLIDTANHPLWGRRLVEVVGRYRYWAGILAMANDENTGVVERGADDDAVVTKRFSEAERVRLADALAFSVAALRAAGAREVVWSGLSTSHVQGTARMGDDPARSVVGPTGRSHDVAGLYVGDASLVPASLSVNPSVTVMALAALVADSLQKELS